MSRLLFSCALSVFLYIGLLPIPALAEEAVAVSLLHSTSSTTTISSLLEGNTDLIDARNNDSDEVTKNLFITRPSEEFSLFSIGAYWVQRAVAEGVPVNTVVLILLLPILATLVAFTRLIVGLPSLGMLVPIALAYTFVALGVSLGLIILGAVVLASFVSRGLLKDLEVMQLPKHALSMLILSLFVFAALTASIMLDIEGVREISIFPVLILTLLGDSIVAIQLRSSLKDTIVVTSVTIALGLLGFITATLPSIRDTIILYPELILLTIPINILIGRYFGLRVTEYFRFKDRI
jgi:hypothetical protein